MSPQLAPAQVVDRLFTRAKPKLRAWMSRNADRIENAFTTWGAGLSDGFQDPYFGHVRVRYFTPATGRQVVVTWEKRGEPHTAMFSAHDRSWAPEGSSTADRRIVTDTRPPDFLVARLHHVYGEQELPVPTEVDPNNAADWLPKSYRSSGATADLPELISRDPRRVEDPYGTLTRALSAYIRARTGVDVPATYWSTVWHWPMANFASMPTVTAQQVYTSLMEAAKSRAETTEHNAESEPLEIRELDRLIENKPWISARTVADWSLNLRGIATANRLKLGSPVYVEMVQDRGPAALQAMIRGEREQWARQLTIAANHADTAIQKYKAETRTLGLDRDYLTAFGEAQGAGTPYPAQVLERAIQRRGVRVREFEAAVVRARREVEKQTLDATVQEAVHHFLAGEDWGYVGGENKAEANAVVHALKAPPPGRAKKPVGYVYGVKGSTLTVWPVLSLADARALFEQVKHEFKDVDGVSIRKSLEEEIVLTRENFPQVTTVDIRPVWTPAPVRVGMAPADVELETRSLRDGIAAYKHRLKQPYDSDSARATDQVQLEARQARLKEIQDAQAAGRPVPSHPSGYFGYVYVAEVRGSKHMLTVYPFRNGVDGKALAKRMVSEWNVMSGAKTPSRKYNVGMPVAMGPGHTFEEEVGLTLNTLRSYGWKIDPSKVKIVLPDVE